MKREKFNSGGHKLRVLVAPLEWGLGHATRCIPIITKLLQYDCEVIIAAEGAGRSLLEQEFPELTFLTLRGYRMKYSRKKLWMPVKILTQFPKILLSIYSEHSWLKKIVKQHHIDAVISDNRFGLYHSAIPCIYITHQLKIKTGLRFTEWLAQKIHYWFISKYTECWVPDAQGTINLAGELSHPSVLPGIPIKYLGCLSRFEKITVEIKYRVAIILSGPEPQRTIFEEMILQGLENHTGKVLLVRGLPGKTLTEQEFGSHIEIKDHLTARELSLAIQQSDLVISRCGYTTVMDLIKLQKKAILVPTPGQTEQEYLAEILFHQKLFVCMKQQYFSLPGALEKAADFPFNKINIPQHDYEKTIEDFVKNNERQF